MKCYIKVFCITLLIQLAGLAVGLLFGDELMNEKLSSGVFLFVYVAGFLIALDDVPFWNPMSFLETNAAFFYVIGLMVSLVVGIVLACHWGKDKKEKLISFYLMPTNMVAVGTFIYCVWFVIWYSTMLVKLFT